MRKQEDLLAYKPSGKNVKLKRDKSTYWNVVVILGTLFCLLLIGGVSAVVDPLFHYHAPLDGITYRLNNERYQNDGIVRNWDYNAIITGTSMTENFKTSECDELFGVHSVKVPFSGAHYKEINENLERAFGANPSITMVVRGLDFLLLISDKDGKREDYKYPTYLTNNCLWDDVNYLLNKEIFISNTLDTLFFTRAGGKTTSFDDYANWNANFEFGKESVMSGYKLGEKKEVRQLSDGDRKLIRENLEQNVIRLVNAHPETTFYLFFPPYSICYWDVQNQNGEVERWIDAEQYAIELLLECPNIKLFCFFTNYDVVCNLENYKDYAHYGEWINSDILCWMKEEEFLLTKENYMEHLNSMRGFYGSYDYASLHK